MASSGRSARRHGGNLFGTPGGGPLRDRFVSRNLWPAIIIVTVSLIMIAHYSGQQYVAATSNHSQLATVTSNSMSQPQTASVRTKPNYLETGRQITGILDRFMSLGYDKRVRPNYGGPPVAVNVTMRILSISSVSEVMMDFTADFYFRQFWHDPRLSFKKLGDIQTLYVGAEVSKKIWLPDTFFGNEKMAYFHEATTPNVFLRIDHSGEVYRSIRLTVTSSCPMNLQYFPMDRQRCTIEAESYGYNIKDIIYRWAHDTAVEQDGQISLPQFDIVKTIQKYRLENLSSGTYSRLIAEIHFARRMGYYLIQIYIPSSLIVVISWVSFWLHRNASPARVQLGVTTVLTMTTLMSSTNAALPKISYVKSIDIFLGTCFVMVFAALLEYATVGYLGKRIAMRKAHAQHAQTQAQARLFAHLQAQGAQGDPVPLATTDVIPTTTTTTTTGIGQTTSGQLDGGATAAATATAAGASLGIFGSSPEFPVEPIHSRHSSQLHMQASSLATLLERDPSLALESGKLPPGQRLGMIEDRHRHHQHPHHHHHHHHHLDHQHQESESCKCRTNIIGQQRQHELCTSRGLLHQHEHEHQPTGADYRQHQASCGHGQRQARAGNKQQCAHSGRLPAMGPSDEEPQPPPRKGFKNSLDASKGNLGSATKPCHHCCHASDHGESREIQTVPGNLESATSQRAHDSCQLFLSTACCNDRAPPRQPTAGACCQTHQPPSYLGLSPPIPGASLSSTLVAPGPRPSPSKGASAAAAAAAATFVNLHRRNKGLPPSTNPNLSQFNSILNPTYNRHLETIFGIRPSDIDKYSRVVFPVCFVCFQLMYWIVYLHISAFLEPDQHSQQHPPQIPVQQPITT